MGNLESLFTYEIVEVINNHHIKVEISPTDNCTNPHGVMHGGITALIIDELAFVIPGILKSNKRYLTTKATIEYHKITRIKPLTAEAILKHEDGPVIVYLYNSSHQLVSTGTVEFLTFNKRVRG